MPEDQAGRERAPKRQAIIEAARMLFIQQGYDETTIPQIARAAGIAVGTIYLYFSTKQEILAAASLDVETALAEAYRDPKLQALPFEQIPRALIASMFRLGRQKQAQMALLQITMPASGENPERIKLMTEISQAIAQFLRRGVAEGRLAPCDTEMYAQLLALLGHAVCHQCFAVEGGVREELYERTMLEMVERLLSITPSSKEMSQNISPPTGEAP